MTQNSPHLLVIVAFFGAILFCGGVSDATSSHKGDLVNGVGAWDVDKHQLEELGKYAVDTHNHESHHQLTFEKVITHKHLPDYGHKLTIAAGHGGVTHTYEAVVAYKPWIQFKKLISFKLAY